jgi:uncharacterized membrane protein YfcA
MLARSTPISPTLGIAAAKYKAENYTWLGTSSSYADSAYFLVTMADAPFRTVEDLRNPALRPAIIVALIGVWVWTAVRPNLGRTQELRWQGQRRHYVVATGAGLAIGFYDGVIGPGTGSFLLIVLVAGLGYSFLQASATAKVVNLTTNVAALIVFGIAGIPLWGLGIMMGVFNILGAVIGARMAISRGSGFVRVVFLVVVAILIFRLGWDQVRTD